MTKTFMLAAALTAAAMVAPAQAAQVFATSYSTPNGDGQASGGTFNYWDLSYSGAGSTTTDGAALSGGFGDLTDGVKATDFWFNVENAAGTGPYVGWRKSNTLNPLLTFNFAGSPIIDQVKFYIDDSGAGGVFAPSAILIDGLATSYVNGGVTNSLITVNLTGLNLTGGSHTIQFFNSPEWVFVSEIEFFSKAVPEPGTWAMMLAGFGIVGGALRRRKHANISFA